MSPEEALEKAKDIFSMNTNEYDKDYDTANGHVEMDDLLCEVLRFLGYGALVDFYEKQERWFEWSKPL